jgi:hypothetical protein
MDFFGNASIFALLNVGRAGIVFRSSWPCSVDMCSRPTETAPGPDAAHVRLAALFRCPSRLATDTGRQ